MVPLAGILRQHMPISTGLLKLNVTQKPREVSARETRGDVEADLRQN